MRYPLVTSVVFLAGIILAGCSPLANQEESHYTVARNLRDNGPTVLEAHFPRIDCRATLAHQNPIPVRKPSLVTLRLNRTTKTDPLPADITIRVVFWMEMENGLGHPGAKSVIITPTNKTDTLQEWSLEIEPTMPGDTWSLRISIDSASGSDYDEVPITVL
jgi:hypothetical protein